jgi:pantetheine-phosphate adenylyltransferase
LCDTLIVAVAVNPAKTPFFSAAERVAMITEACRELKNIEVTSFEGLLSDFCFGKTSRSCSGLTELFGLRL